ncbi:MAG: hypothetical protein WBC40_03695 [Halobacteriota archaeon]
MKHVKLKVTGLAPVHYYFLGLLALQVSTASNCSKCATDKELKKKKR